MGWDIPDNQIESGLLDVVKNTKLLGRWQELSNNPLTICDTGHNEAGVKEVVGQLLETTYSQLHIVFGTVNDKSIDKVIDLLPIDATYYFCAANIPRALAAEDLFSLAKQKGLIGGVYASVGQAFAAAKAKAASNDLIFIGGSTFVVAEVV